MNSLQAFRVFSSWLSLTVLLGLISCVHTPPPAKNEATDIVVVDSIPAQDSIQLRYLKAFAERPDWMATSFDYPVGKPNANGYYNAQSFGKNEHLGDDWNGTGGGNSDLGDEVYCIADGWVSSALDRFGGWGKVVRVVHKLEGNSTDQFVESLYAHLDSIIVEKGSWIKKGDQIGTIGNADGAYLAHLHLEIRNRPAQSLGGGYGKSNHHVDPTAFIKAHRGQ